MKDTIEEHGPASDSGEADALLAKAIREEMRITCHEAAQPEVWQFVACVLLPDVLLWRFGSAGNIVTARRWQGDLRRNAFARLWWRAEILSRKEGGSVDIQVLRELREDEIVQIMERPSLSGNPVLARCVAHSFVRALKQPSAAVEGSLRAANGRQLIMRELTKRLLRVGCIRPFDVLGEAQLQSLVAEQLEVTCESICLTVAPPVRMAA